jgi:hypothetical protein
MKNIVPVVLGVLLCLSHAKAQDTLTQSSYPLSVIGIDSLKKTTYNSSFPVLTASVAGIWDMSVVTDTTPVFFSYRVPGAGSYQFADSNTYLFGPYIYKGNVQSNINYPGILEYSINTGQANYSLSSLTSGSTDSLFIPSQTVSFSFPRTRIAFPTIYNTSWSSAYTSDFNFQISIFALSYNHAPGLLRAYTTETDTVIGWGKMRVKDIAGNPSLYFNVLQVKTVIITTDSFFVNGSPASTLMLSALGLFQGQPDTTYQQNYYRKGELTPLAQVNFKDATFAQPKSATTHVQRLADNAVTDAVNDRNVTVYPNPVCGNLILLELPTQSGNWSYQLVDVSGKVILDDQLRITGTHASFELPASVTPGVYHVVLNIDGRPYCVKEVNIQNR